MDAHYLDPAAFLISCKSSSSAMSLPADQETETALCWNSHSYRVLQVSGLRREIRSRSWYTYPSEKILVKWSNGIIVPNIWKKNPSLTMFNLHVEHCLTKMWISPALLCHQHFDCDFTRNNATKKERISI
jgi:hypothetical protein